MTETIATDSPFTAPERTLLEVLAERMIPAEGTLPSAADPAILGEVVAALAKQPDVARAGLDHLAALAAERFQTAFPALGEAEQLELVAALRADVPAFLTLFESSVAACYYRDDRVLQSLDMPARAPFPEGNAVPPTDWSLLDPVRQRAPFYRNI